jgi:aliphatic nitrilase
MAPTFKKFKVAAVQASPVWLDLDGTVERTCALIREAARNGAALVAFPEVFIPAYPYWLWLDSPLKGYDYFVRLYRNSVAVPSPATERLCAAAREHGIHVVVGINEIDHVRFGTIYNTNLFIDRRGQILGKHRKLVPTFAEKMIWGSGDGSTLRVYDTDIGRLGGLNCGENTNTLARFALLSQGEQIHVANYPAFPFKDRFDIKSAIIIRAGAHAFEGKIYVVVSTSAINAEMRRDLADTDEKRRWLETREVAVSGIFGPDGQPVGDLLVDEEGIVYADVDLEQCLVPKLFHDITGHYNRFDVLSLTVNDRALSPLAPGTAPEPARKGFDETPRPGIPGMAPGDLRARVRELLDEELAARGILRG